MKNLTHTILFCTLALVSPLGAAPLGASETESVSLDCDSRNEVAVATIGGGLAGLAAFFGFHMLTSPHFCMPCISEHPYSATFCTVAGAAIAGFWKYQYTPEKHFEFARKELLGISQNELFTLLVTVEADKLIGALKDRYFREKLPLYTAFKQLDKICSLVDQSKNSLNEVLASHRTDLYQESNELQMIADMYLVILKEIFIQLKDDPNFISECNAGTLELMKEAQEAAAHAAQSSAFSQQMALMSSTQSSVSVQVSV